MTEDRKVRKFLQGIRASYLQTEVSTVIATPNLSDNFDRCVNYLTRFIERRGQYKETRTISSLTNKITNRDEGTSPKTQSNRKAMNQYQLAQLVRKGFIPQRVWDKLSETDKSKIRQLRSDDDRRKKQHSKKRKDNSPAQNVAKKPKQDVINAVNLVSKLATHLSQSVDPKKDDANTSTEEEVVETISRLI